MMRSACLVLRVEGNDGSLWLDWSTPQAKPVVTPGLAYLMNQSLSDETARAGRLAEFERAGCR